MPKKIDVFCLTDNDISPNLNDKKTCQNILTTILVNAMITMTRKGVKHNGELNIMPLLNRLKEYRSRLNMNQTELGKKAGVSRQTISLIERGDYSPSVTLALTIAKVCGVTVEEVFYLQEETENEK